MRIRQFNKLVGFIGFLALIVGPLFFSFTITNFLLLIAAVTVFEIFSMYFYRKYRFRKNKNTSTI